jgi:uncharacterized membrane protein YphA (DoxX/SURF4 family)
LEMIMRNSSASCLLLIVAIVHSFASPRDLIAQDDASLLINGGFETVDDSGRPEGWRFIAQPASNGQTLTTIQTAPFAGKAAARIECINLTNRFTNLMQATEAQSVRGKRVRFRAAVKTEQLKPTDRVQLWFRVDRIDGMGAFDNMQERPIRDTEWTHHDIVLDVADDATKLNVGIFIIGIGIASIDDASLAIVSDQVATTGGEIPMPQTTKELQQARQSANAAPTQPFLTLWMLPALIAIALFGLANVRQSPPISETHQDDTETSDSMRALPKFALRFSVVYWSLYCLPSTISETLVRAFASKVLGISKTLVLPNGSGDTTYSYVQALLIFVIAMTGALIWTALDRRKTDYRLTHDLLRSLLRYMLAFIMLSYGLAKIGWFTNQFPTPNALRLASTYGESSPMGLLWTFMGASRPYTIFAGLGEVIGGLLLLMRRTATVGALIVFGVMTNVMMMNFCYDVPVKLYSAHLVLMSVFILLPDLGRLFSLLVLNRPTHPIRLAPPYVQGKKMIWCHRGWKICVLILVMWRLGNHVARERTHWAESMAKAKASRESDALLMNRGFRWINEVPFNR